LSRLFVFCSIFCGVVVWRLFSILHGLSLKYLHHLKNGFEFCDVNFNKDKTSFYSYLWDKLYQSRMFVILHYKDVVILCSNKKSRASCKGALVDYDPAFLLLVKKIVD
jgi:hypothetical protein